MIVPTRGSYAIAPEQIDRLIQRDGLAVISVNLAEVPLPADEPVTPATAETLFREGSALRQTDFAGSAQRYLQAARIQLEALRADQLNVGFDNLKWYLASYCSVKAGQAFVSNNYTKAVPYYLAFFSLAQEADSVWPRIQRLVNPMSSYFFAIAGRQVNETVPPNLGRSPACQVAYRIHNHSNPRVREAWEELMAQLAVVNLGIIYQLHRDLTSAIGSAAHTGGNNVSSMERTRSFLADLIAEQVGG